MFDAIKQITTDSVSNVTQIKVQPYGELVLYACKALGHGRWDMCVATHFYNHLAPKIKDHLSLTYTPGVIARDPSTQTHAIQRILILATAVERQIEGTWTLIQSHTNLALMANNVAFFGQANADPPAGGDAAAPSSASTLSEGTARVSTYTSPAERTITQNPGNTTLLSGQD